MDKMSAPTVREIVRRKKKEYLKAGKGEKVRILNEVQELTGYHRKSLVRLLVEGIGSKMGAIRRPRASKYEGILPHLRML